MKSIALTPQDHQVFTNAWRNAIGYVNSQSVITTTSASPEQIWLAAQLIYADYPILLDAVRITIFGE